MIADLLQRERKGRDEKCGVPVNFAAGLVRAMVLHCVRNLLLTLRGDGRGKLRESLFQILQGRRLCACLYRRA